MPDLDALLHEFADAADEWFEESTRFDENYAFIQDFFEPENLEEAEWEDFQQLGRHIYALQTPRIAYGNAFGEPNHPLAHYRESFAYLAHGDGSVAERVDRLVSDPELSIDYVKGSTLGELAGMLFPEDYQMLNSRAVEAAQAAGIDALLDSGRAPGERLKAFSEATGPVVEAYREIVGPRTGLPIRLEVDQFFNWLYQTKMEGNGLEGKSSQNTWLLAPGRQTQFWEYWQEQNIIAIGWDELGDLRDYNTKEDIENGADRISFPDAKACWEFSREMREGDLVFVKANTTTILGAALVTSDYRHDPDEKNRNRNQRDVQWVRTGEWETLPRTFPRDGWDRDKKESGDWREEPRILPRKTLTEIGKYDRMAAELEILLGIDGEIETGLREPLSINEETLETAVDQVIGPRVENKIFREGGESYLHDQRLPSGQKHLLPEALREDPNLHAQKALPTGGTNPLGWREVDRANNVFEQADSEELRQQLEHLLRGDDPLEERLEAFLEWGRFDDTAKINGTVASYLLAMECPALYAFCKPTVYKAAAEALLGPEAPIGSAEEAKRIVHASRLYGEVLRRLRREFDLPLRHLLDVHAAFYILSSRSDYDVSWDDLSENRDEEKTSSVSKTASDPSEMYSVERATEGLFYPPGTFRSWLDRLRRKKNVILQGPPGVGKTFVSKKLAYALMGEKAEHRVQMVQLHQSYTYEDFIRGYRPEPDGGFRLRDGVFFRFCQTAKDNPDRDYVFIIDEINRGNLSKIFGELMMLIEPDKRGSQHAVPLAYQREEDDTFGRRFYVPENVHLLGMMNTADRSLAMVDYALRRRFAFVDMEPRFHSERFRRFLYRQGAEDALIDRIVTRIRSLNEAIAEDTNLGPGFKIGHSYFCPSDDQVPDERWYGAVVDREIAPLLREYWFDDPETAEEHIESLQA